MKKNYAIYDDIYTDEIKLNKEMLKDIVKKYSKGLNQSEILMMSTPFHTDDIFSYLKNITETKQHKKSKDATKQGSLPLLKAREA